MYSRDSQRRCAAILGVSACRSTPCRCSFGEPHFALRTRSFLSASASLSAVGREACSQFDVVRDSCVDEVLDAIKAYGRCHFLLLGYCCSDVTLLKMIRDALTQSSISVGKLRIEVSEKNNTYLLKP